MSFFNRGDTAAAEQRCHQLLASARSPDALHLLGLCLLRTDRTQAAIESLREAIRLAPDNAQLQHDLGRAHSARGDWRAAAEAYLRAIDLRPDYAETYLYLGPVYEQVGDTATAERAYRRALELDPRLATAAASLAALYEKQNCLEEAQQLTTDALKLDPQDTVANLTQAQLQIRAGCDAEAAERLKTLLQQPLSPWNRAIAASRLGTAYDKLDDTEQAFAAFIVGKDALRNADLSTLETGVYSRETAMRISRHAEKLLETVGPAPGNTPAPVFLVGFPRSGTTLLDQILSSHPRLRVLEEKDTLLELLRIWSASDAKLTQLETMPSAAFENEQQAYWKRVQAQLGEPLGDRILVDKLPLYSQNLPLIHRFFPGARYLFAVRDPRDVVLSCFMHSFGLNEAMRHFLTLEGTADYYAAVMDVAVKSLPRLGASAYRLRYEDLVDDLEKEARRLCEFLGVPWDEAMLHSHDKAKGRRINTPSYHQVVQPVYRTALERWRRYATPLAPVLARLQPYVEFFGYA
ncbi:MAG TPA: sulfotransferase [Gammaproteobacteria bacterium]|nr:sulfotransferase [Gammaproteobacteria bacterium]